MNYQPIRPSTHARAGWLSPDSLAFAKAWSCLPVVLAELSQVIQIAPLVFRESDTGPLELCALCGLTVDENVFITREGKWIAPYIPSVLRLYPFAMPLLRPGESEDRQLCFDQDSGLFVEAGDAIQVIRFFEDSGQPSATLQQVLHFATEQVKSGYVTRQAVQCLQQHELLVPLDLPTPSIPLTSAPVTVYGVDELRLQALSPAELKTLQQNNALLLAYAQLLSTSRLANLPKLYTMHHPQTSDSANLDTIDQLFGEHDDLLKFNF